jgi:hypothetical protein
MGKESPKGGKKTMELKKKWMKTQRQKSTWTFRSFWLWGKRNIKR